MTILLSMIKGSDYHRIEKAIGYLAENVRWQPSLTDLSEFLGLSEFHCHRLFKRWAGVTPKDFLQILTLSEAKKRLAESESLLHTSLDVGLSGSSRLHDLFIRYEAMTPGQYKREAEGLEIFWYHFDSPVGKIAVASTHQGVCSLSFEESESKALKFLESQWPKAKIIKKPLKSVAAEILERLKKGPQSELRLFMKGSPFQVKVWEALLRIPEGHVVTYQGLAHLIGAPNSARAVGSAVGANPIGYLIPCHRVIKSTGAIGEYHWGAQRKTALLTLENARARPSGRLLSQKS